MRQPCLLTLTWLLLAANAWTQPLTGARGNTYAVIVGISSYDQGITKLDFAHRDAQEFDKFLRSRAGGSVPAGHIRLLLNGDASYSAIYNALYWLLDTCKKDDLVYFYFSGHGDVEQNTIYKLGFLLAANTPRFNYINNAIRIEDVNIIANSISADKGAKVVVITDACRSGKLAGSDNRGNFLVGKQLQATQKNEIRITSSGPDELSNEDAGWAGGRGVFSYYLVRGLEGLADYSKDQVVTLDEIRTYLRTSLAADRLLAQKEHKQNPVVTGPADAKLAAVDRVKVSMSPMDNDATRSVDDAAPALAQLGVSPQGYLLSLAADRKLENAVDFNVLHHLSKEEIAFEFIQMLSVPQTPEQRIDSAKIGRLTSSLRTNKDAMRRFNDKLVELMADRGQEVINLYLEGDEAELEKRRYYNSLSNGYDVYVKMFATALKLVSPQSPLYHILQVKYHYFSGITARLKILVAANPLPLLDTAMREQQAAYQLQPDAAYIHNELGILYNLRKEYGAAEKHFLRATQIAPTWALPWSNLSGLYSVLNEQGKGLDAVTKARKLQPNLQGAYINTGILYEKKGNLLLGEEYFRKSIRMNTRHYLPFERMGYVCMNTTRYAEADSNFLEADKRKRGYRFIEERWLPNILDANFDVAPPAPPCPFDTATVKPNDVIGNFHIGMMYLWERAFAKAEVKFKQVIRIDPSNPVVFHQLGKLLYDQQRWKEADLIFNYAINYQLDSARFSRYCDSLAKSFPQYAEGGKYSCILMQFKFARVEKKINRFFLATAYENWNHYEEAEQQFRTIIREDSTEIAAWCKLWTLLERTGRYQDAEAVIRSLPDTVMVRSELFALYKRIIANHPLKGEWYYKAGSLMYEMVATGPDRYPDDMKYFKADSEQETFVTRAGYRKQQHHLYYVPGTGQGYQLYGDIMNPITEGIRYFRKADSLLSDDEQLAEINYKTGDLYVWQGLPQRADTYYKRSVDLRPDDANARLKYIYTTITNYNYEWALEQLDSLNKRGEINYPAQVLMARYCMHAGRYTDAAGLLKEARAIHPYQPDELTDLDGRLQLLAGKPLQAIPFYKDYLNRHRDDAETSYTIARLYAKAKNSAEAWKWLTQAINKGFSYYWVLKYDESWDSYRSNPKWSSLTKDIRQKE